MYSRVMSTALASRLSEDEVVDGPRWQDHCEHLPGSYVGTVMVNFPSKTSDLQPLDVYVYENRLRLRQDVCIRYGNEPEDYYSPGSVIDLISSFASLTDMWVYGKVIALILSRMTCRWHKDEVALVI